MVDNTASASTLPIKDETDLAIEARAKAIMEQYDVSMEEAMQIARGEAMESMDAPPPPPAAADRLVQQHMAAGMPEDRARRLAGNQVRVYGEQGAQGVAGENDTPAGRERLAQAWQETQEADTRHQRMYDDYFAATGAPGTYTPSADVQAQEDYQRRWGEEWSRARREGLHSQQPIDPVDPNFVSRGAQEEADQKAERDAQMEAVFKNIRQKYGPDEEASARAAYAQGKLHVPQTDNQRSRNQARRNLELDAMRGSDEARQRLRAQEAGVNYDGLDKAGLDELRAPGGNMSASREKGMMQRLRVQAGLHGQIQHPAYNNADLLRELIAGNREAQRASKEAMWRPRTMIRGGNAIGALAVPGLTPGQEAGILGGPTPLAANALTARQVLNMMNAEALAGMDPFNRNMQREAMEQRRQLQETSLPADQKVAVSRGRGEPMGTGLSSGPVQAAWNSAMTETGFRRQMEAAGYSLAEIDAWIDERRNADHGEGDSLSDGPSVSGRGGHTGGGELFGPGGGL